MKIDRELIFRGVSRNGGWSREQLNALGVEWPPVRGWIERIEGTEIDNAHADLFIGLRDAHLGEG